MGSLCNNYFNKVNLLKLNIKIYSKSNESNLIHLTENYTFYS